MSGYPGGHQDHYDDGYGHQSQQVHQGGNTDSYYQDDQYYDNGYDARGGHAAQGAAQGAAGGHAGEGYYDESLVPFPEQPGRGIN